MAAAAAAPVRMAEAGINPNFDPQGFWDVCVPLVLAMFAVGLVFQALEARLYAGVQAAGDRYRPEGAADGDKRKGGRKVTHVFCTGVVARVLLLLLPWAPYPFRRTRWDWVCTAPTVYETLAHLYHWRDTTAKLKWSLLGHHAVVLLVVWPLARCVILCVAIVGWTVCGGLIVTWSLSYPRIHSPPHVQQTQQADGDGALPGLGSEHAVVLRGGKRMVLPLLPRQEPRAARAGRAGAAPGRGVCVRVC